MVQFDKFNMKNDSNVTFSKQFYNFLFTLIHFKFRLITNQDSQIKDLAQKSKKIKGLMPKRHCSLHCGGKRRRRYVAHEKICTYTRKLPMRCAFITRLILSLFGIVGTLIFEIAEIFRKIVLCTSVCLLLFENWASPMDAQVNDFVGNIRAVRFIEFSSSCSALPDPCQDHPSELVTFDEVKSIVSSRNNKLSSGSDGLPNRVLKLLDDKILVKLTVFFNQLIASGHFPSCWKHANIIPIPKAGRNSDLVANWRPISLLPCLSKIFERLLVVRLREFVLDKKVVPSHQFGFMPQHSTNHALAILQNKINDNLNNKVVTSLVCLDIQAAFDTVWHNGLLFKLNKLQCPAYLVLIIKNFLENRTFCVKVGNSVSSSKPVIAGVPQGSVLGPLLFNISNYDIPVSDLYDILQFADDTAVTFSYASVKGIEQRINSCLVLVADWYRSWKFKLNAEKTELIHFVGNCKQIKSYTRKLISKLNINVNNVALTASQNVKYLGVVFARNGKFNRHVDKTLVKFNNAKNSLNGLIFSQLISVELKKFLYSVYLRPILAYAAPVWTVPSNLSSHQMERLRIAERKLVRCTHNVFRKRGSFKYLSNQLLYNQFKYDRFDVFCAFLSIRFHSNNSYNANPLIKLITQEYNVNVINACNLKRTDYIYNLWLSNELFNVNDQLSLFNRAAFMPHTSVYSVAQ